VLSSWRTAVIGIGIRLLDTATENGKTDGLTILGSGSGTGTWLGLLDAILVSLVILGLGSGGHWSVGMRLLG